MRTAPNITDDVADRLLSLPFDHYERYALTQRLVALLWPQGKRRKPLRVLDVGGHSSSLKHFLPDDVIVLVDVQKPPAFTYREKIPFLCDGYLQAAGGMLPFVDGSFDLVTAHDTLEHVRNEDRPAFLRDVLRVARRFVIVNGPVFHLETAHAEERLALFMNRALSEENRSLREHLDLGLPNKELIEGVLREQGLAFITIPNGDLKLWLAMMAMKHYLMALPGSEGLHDVVDRAFNSTLSRQDIGGLCYREAYVIAKHPSDVKALREAEAVFEPLLARPSLSDSIEFPEELLEALEEHAAEVRGLLAALAEKDLRIVNLEAALATKEQQVADAQAALAAKDQHIANVESALAEQGSLLAQRETALQEATQQLDAIQLSLGYRLLNAYRRAIRWLMPPGSRRALPYRALRRAVRWIVDSWPRPSS